MKIGFVSRIGEFPEKEWLGEFETARKAGVNHLELIINYPFFGPQTATPNQISELARLARENDLELIFHLLPNQYQLPEDVRHSDAPQKFQDHEEYLRNKVFNIASSDEKVRKFSIEEIKRTIEIAERVHAPLVVIHGGSFEEEEYYATALGRSRKSLEELNLYLREVKLAVENLPILGHSGNPVNELPIYSRDLIYLVKGLENIGICFDIAHANTSGNPIEFYKELRKTGKVWDMHIHDNAGERDDHLALDVLEEGGIDFEGFMRILKDDDYRGYFSIELDTWNEFPDAMEKRERIEGLEYLKKLG